MDIIMQVGKQDMNKCLPLVHVNLKANLITTR
jgi:hypothetical protein